MLYGIQTLLLIHVYSALDDPYLLFSHDVVQFCNDYDDKSGQRYSLSSSLFSSPATDRK